MDIHGGVKNQLGKLKYVVDLSKDRWLRHEIFKYISFFLTINYLDKNNMNISNLKHEQRLVVFGICLICGQKMEKINLKISFDDIEKRYIEDFIYNCDNCEIGAIITFTDGEFSSFKMSAALYTSCW